MRTFAPLPFLALGTSLASLACAYPSTPAYVSSVITAKLLDRDTILFDGQVYTAGVALPGSNRRTNGDEVTPEEPGPFFQCLGMTFICICLSALASGLMLGLLSIDKLQMQILLEADLDEIHDAATREDMARQKNFAATIWPIIRNHHQLLVTLLLLNALANEALPIFLDRSPSHSPTPPAHTSLHTSLPPPSPSTLSHCHTGWCPRPSLQSASPCPWCC